MEDPARAGLVDSNPAGRSGATGLSSQLNGKKKQWPAPVPVIALRAFLNVQSLLPREML